MSSSDTGPQYLMLFNRGFELSEDIIIPPLVFLKFNTLICFLQYIFCLNIVILLSNMLIYTKIKNELGDKLCLKN